MRDLLNAAVAGILAPLTPKRLRIDPDEKGDEKGVRENFCFKRYCSLTPFLVPFLVPNNSSRSRFAARHKALVSMEVFVGRPPKLYRYSERRLLERSLRLGEFRLRPASEYLNAEAAVARQDDERNRVSILKNGEFVMTLERTGEVIETTGDVTHISSIDRDYLTLCFSSRWDTHHFKDFEGSDACLIVHHPTEVLERIHEQIEKQFPGWVSIDAPVLYGRKSTLGVPFSKPGIFAFQSEHRLVLVPSESRTLDAMIVTIGSIENMAEIVDEA